MTVDNHFQISEDYFTTLTMLCFVTRYFSNVIILENMSV